MNFPTLALTAALLSLQEGALSVTATPMPFQMALDRIERNYPKLNALRQEIASARAREQERRGAFDPVATAGLESQRYNSSSYPGKAYDTTSGFGQVEVTDISGVKLYGSYRLNTGKVKSPLSSTGEFGEPFLGVLVPLSRGYAINSRAVALQQARLAIPLAERTVAQARLETLRDGAAAYWEWTAAAARLKVARDVLTTAKDRADAVRRRFEAGDERQMSVVEAGAEVERRQGAVARAERDLQKAGLKLGLYLWDEKGEPLPFDPYAPAPVLPAPERLEDAQAESAIQRGLEKRPEIEVVDLSRDVLQLSLDLARNDRRPALDFGVGTGYDMGAGGIGPTYKLGIYLTVPLRQNAADGRIADAEAKLRKLELDRSLLALAIRTEIRDAVSAVRTAYDRVTASQAELNLSRRLERMERTAFDLGESTIFLLNQRERARVEAEGRLIDVLAEYQQALAALRAASADF